MTQPKFILRIREKDAKREVQVRSFTETQITLGRAVSNDVVLSNRNKAVSRRHAQIVQRGEGFELIDLGSKNTTRLRHRKLAVGEAAALSDGDRIQIGDFEIEFSLPPELGGLLRNGRPVTDDSETKQAFLPRGTESTLNELYPHSETGYSLKELLVLSELAADINTCSDIQEFKSRVKYHTGRVVDADRSELTLADDVGTPAYGSDTRLIDHRLVRDLLQWVVMNKQHIRLTRERASWLGIALGPRTSEALAVPLMVGDTPIGILTVMRERDSDAFGDDDLRLLTIIAAQAAQFVENVRLRHEERALLEVRSELDVARRIQESLLPARPPRFSGYDIAGRSVPAQSIGGDYFDYIRLDRNRLGFCVGDVSGKGLPAALLMANVQATIRAEASRSASIAETLRRANELIHENTPKGSFVTLFCGILDRETHEFTFANAGHNRPVILRKDGSLEILNHGDMVLGGFADQDYHEHTTTIGEGDVLVVYTDGITEARSSRGQFGEERLVDLIRECPDCDAEEILDRIYEAASRHAGDALRDDMTLVVVRRPAS